MFIPLYHREPLRRDMVITQACALYVTKNRDKTLSILHLFHVFILSSDARCIKVLTIVQNIPSKRIYRETFWVVRLGRTKYRNTLDCPRKFITRVSAHANIKARIIYH